MKYSIKYILHPKMLLIVIFLQESLDFPKFNKLNFYNYLRMKEIIKKLFCFSDISNTA